MLGSSQLGDSKWLAVSHKLTTTFRPNCLTYARPVTHEQFEELCGKYDELRLELTSTGELIVMPPTGMETGVRNAHLTYQLMAWSEKDGSGVCFGNTRWIYLAKRRHTSAGCVMD